MQSKPIDILLVEDNLGDIRLTQEAFKETKVRNKLIVVRDGAAALDYLHQRGEYEAATRPGLIMLDLNLPKKQGNEVLADIKNSEILRRIPVIILTSSEAEQDIKTAYDLHANCYIAKPVDTNKLVQVISSIEHFWLEIVNLPSE